MTSLKLGRRNILRTLGLTAGSTLFPSFHRSAQAAAPPKRFLIMFSYHGTLPQFWTPTAGTETDFPLNSLMKPYEAFKNDLVLLDRLAFKSAIFNPSDSNGHESGHIQALSAAKPFSKSLAGGPSIDQVIARGLQVKTKFPSLELGVTDDGGFGAQDYISYSGPGQPMPSEANPTKTWSNVFKGFAPAGGGSAPVAVVADAEAIKQKSILDYVKGEVDVMAKRLGSFDKARLENHMAAVRDLENSLSLGSGSGALGGQASGCAAVPQLMGGGFAQILDAQIKMIQMAFACDLTRVATLNIEELSAATSGYLMGIGGTSDPHDLAHKTAPDGGLLQDDPEPVEAMRKYHLVYANAFNKVLTALTMPDVDGKRLLDNTIVLWAGEIATGGHSLQNFRWVLAGSGGGSIRTGRWLKCNNVSHQNLYVTIARAMGLTIDKFGEPSTCTGALPLS